MNCYILTFVFCQKIKSRIKLHDNKPFQKSAGCFPKNTKSSHRLAIYKFTYIFGPVVSNLHHKAYKRNVDSLILISSPSVRILMMWKYMFVPTDSSKDTQRFQRNIILVIEKKKKICLIELYLYIFAALEVFCVLLESDIFSIEQATEIFGTFRSVVLDNTKCTVRNHN